MNLVGESDPFAPQTGQVGSGVPSPSAPRLGRPGRDGARSAAEVEQSHSGTRMGQEERSMGLRGARRMRGLMAPLLRFLELRHGARLAPRSAPGNPISPHASGRIRDIARIMDRDPCNIPDPAVGVVAADSLGLRFLAATDAELGGGWSGICASLLAIGRLRHVEDDLCGPLVARYMLDLADCDIRRATCGLGFTCAGMWIIDGRRRLFCNGGPHVENGLSEHLRLC
jgi:hypothetical protein